MFLHKTFEDQLTGASQTPCSACSWTPDQQARCRYYSHVKLIEGLSDMGVWSIGSRLILRESGNNPPKLATRNLRFIKENTTIPVPTVIEEWLEDNGQQKHRVAKQTADYVKQLRALHSDKIQSVDGEGVHDAFLFGNEYHTPHGPISSDEEFWAELEKGLSDIPEEVRQRLRKKMPSGAPYTFTHGFVLPWEIMVEDGNVTGFTGWWTSGYFPCWWESARSRLCFDIIDMEFHSFLAEYFPRNIEADDFYVDLLALRRTHDEDKYLSERRNQLLKGLDADANDSNTRGTSS